VIWKVESPIPEHIAIRQAVRSKLNAA